MKTRSLIYCMMASLLWASGQAIAQETYQKVGPSTGQPIPRYISIKTSEANMRRGPSQEYPVDWIYHRAGYPVRVIGESGHWRKVEDVDGVKGWFHYALLNGTRHVIVLNERQELRVAAAENAQLAAILEKGVIAKLLACTNNWCEVEVNAANGWVPKSGIWGVDADEIFEE